MVCYIDNLNTTPEQKLRLQAQHEYYFNDLVGRSGFESIDGYLVPDNQGKEYLISQNKEVGKIYSLSEEPINNVATKVVAVNVLNLSKDYEPKAIHDYLLDISVTGKPEYKDLATILQYENFTKDVRIVNQLDKAENEINYFGKITADEILIDKEFIESEAIKNGLNPTDEFHKILLHEFVHDLVDDNLKTNKDLYSKLFELKEIADKVAYDNGLPFKNPFIDTNEFVVEAFTNTEFQKFLKTIPYKGEQTLWNKFIEVMNTFMKKLGLTNYSVLDEVLSLSNEIFEKNNQEITEELNSLPDSTKEQTEKTNIFEKVIEKEPLTVQSVTNHLKSKFGNLFTNVEVVEQIANSENLFLSQVQVLGKLGIKDPFAEFYLQQKSLPVKQSDIKGKEDFYGKAKSIFKVDFKDYLIDTTKGLTDAQKRVLILEARNGGNNDIANYAELNINDNKVFEPIVNQLNDQKESRLKLWYDYITIGNDAYAKNPFIQYFVWQSITKELDKNTMKSLPPQLNQGVLAQLIYKASESNTISSPKNFIKQYNDLLAELALSSIKKLEVKGKTDTIGKWVYIPSKKEDPLNFESNVKKLQSLSYDGKSGGTSWCTKTYNAEPYLSEGGFYLYIEQPIGKEYESFDTKIAIRLVGDSIQEIQGQNNDGTIPFEYLEQIEKLRDSKEKIDDTQSISSFEINNWSEKVDSAKEQYEELLNNVNNILIEIDKDPELREFINENISINLTSQSSNKEKVKFYKEYISEEIPQRFEFFKQDKKHIEKFHNKDLNEKESEDYIKLITPSEDKNKIILPINIIPKSIKSNFIFINEIQISDGTYLKTPVNLEEYLSGQSINLYRKEVIDIHNIRIKKFKNHLITQTENEISLLQEIQDRFNIKYLFIESLKNLIKNQVNPTYNEIEEFQEDFIKLSNREDFKSLNLRYEIGYYKSESTVKIYYDNKHIHNIFFPTYNNLIYLKTFLEKHGRGEAVIDDLPFSKKQGLIEGSYNPVTDKVQIATNSISSIERAEQVFLHEVVGHRGVENLLSEKNKTEYNRIIKLYEKELFNLELNIVKKAGYSSKQDFVSDYHFDLSTEQGEINYLKELIARVSEDEEMSKATWFERLINQVKELLSKVFNVEYNNKDLRIFLSRARNQSLKNSTKVKNNVTQAEFRSLKKELTTLDFANQDSKLSNAQISIELDKQLKERKKELFNQLATDVITKEEFDNKVDNILNELVSQEGVVFTPVYFRPENDMQRAGELVGLYYKESDPTFPISLVGYSKNELQDAIDATIRDYRTVYGVDMPVQNLSENNIKEKIQLKEKQLLNTEYTEPILTPIDYTNKFVTSNESTIKQEVEEVQETRTEEINEQEDFSNVDLDSLINNIKSDLEDNTLKQIEDSQTIPQSNEEIVEKLKESLAINFPEFNLQIVDRLDANGLVDFSDKIVYIKKNRATALSEEYAHVFLALSPLDKRKVFLDLAVNTNLYADVFSEYSRQSEYWKDGKIDIDKIKEETAAKLIAEAIYAQNTGDFSKFDEWVSDRSKKGFIKTLLDAIKDLIRRIKKETKFEPFHQVAKDILSNNIVREEKSAIDWQLMQIENEGYKDTINTLNDLYLKEKKGEERGGLLIKQMEQAYSILKDNLNNIVRNNYTGILVPVENQKRLNRLLDNLKEDESINLDIAKSFVTTFDGVSSFATFALNRINENKGVLLNDRIREFSQIHRFTEQWKGYIDNLRNELTKANSVGFVGDLASYMQDIENQLSELDRVVYEQFKVISAEIIKEHLQPAVSGIYETNKAKVLARNSNWSEEMFIWFQENQKEDFEKTIEDWNKRVTNPQSKFDNEIAEIGVITSRLYKLELKSVIDHLYTTDRITDILTGKEVKNNKLSNLLYGASTSRDPITAVVQKIIDSLKVEAADIARKTVSDHIEILTPSIKETGMTTIQIGAAITETTKRQVNGEDVETRGYLTDVSQLLYIEDEKRKQKLRKLKQDKLKGGEYKKEKAEYEKWKLENFFDDKTDEFYKVKYKDENYINKLLNPNYVENLTEEQKQNRIFAERYDKEREEINNNIAALEEELSNLPYFVNGELNLKIEEIENQIEDEHIKSKNMFSKYRNGKLKNEEDIKFAEYLQSINKRKEGVEPLYNYKERPYALSLSFNKFLENKVKQLSIEEYNLPAVKMLKEELSKEVGTVNMNKVAELIDSISDSMEKLGKPSEIKKWSKKNIKRTYTENYYKEVGDLKSERTEILEEMYGKSKDSPKEYEERRAILKEFKDIDGIINPTHASVEISKEIKRIDEYLESTKSGKSEVISGNKTKELKKRLSEINNKLSELEEKITTPYYRQKLQEFDIEDSDMFLERINSISIYELEDIDRFKELATEIGVPVDKQNDFYTWFFDNHFLTNKYVGFFNEEIWSPTYMWVETRPRDYTNKYVTYTAGRKYQKSTINPYYVNPDTQFINGIEISIRDEFGRLKPRPFDRNGNKTKAYNEEYFRLKNSNNPKDVALFKILETLKERHVAAQLGDDNNPGNANMLYFVIPQRVKEIFEDMSLKGVTAFAERFAAQNQAEGGSNFQQDLSDSTVGEKEEQVKQSVVSKMINKIFRTNRKSNKTTVRTNYSGERIYRAALNLYNHVDVDKLSTDIFYSQAEFVQESAIHQAYMKAIPSLTIIDRTLKKTRSNEKRTEAFENQMDRSVQGINKLYELGERADRWIGRMKKVTSIRSQTIFNPKGSLKNFLAATGNLFVNSSTFSDADLNEASSRWVRKYKSIKTQMLTNAPKDFDFRVFEYFSPGLTNKFKYSMSDKLYRTLKTGDIFGSSMAEGELIVAGISMELFLERDFKGRKLRESLTFENGRLKLENGTAQDLIDLKLSFDEKMRQVQGNQGAQKNKVEASRYTTGDAILHFRNYLAGMLINRFSTTRTNFTTNEEMEGYWFTMYNLITSGTIELGNAQDMWAQLTDMEKRNVIKAAKELALVISLILLLYILGYSDLDDDRFKKMKDNNYFHNLLIYESLTVYQETIGISPLRGYAMATESISNVKQTSLAFGEVGKVVTLGKDFGFWVTGSDKAFAKKNTAFQDKGDIKWIEDLNKLIGINNAQATFNNEMLQEQTKNYVLNIERQ